MREWLERRFADLVTLFAALGFLTLLLELLLTGHTEGVQVLAPLAALVGAVALGLGFLGARTLALGLLLLVSATSLLGMAEHLGEALEAQGPTQVRLVDEEGKAYPGYPWGKGEGREKEGTPPPLAPLSLAGLGLLGALALYVRRP